jgi:16S rRNA (cytidine1402-2'-O)-methyltransferase
MSARSPLVSPLQASPAEPARQYVLNGTALIVPQLAAGLYLVATPIGNLGDITLRALEVLAAADLIACEDTRRTGKLLSRYGIARPMSPYHDHNAEAARPKLLAQLAGGASIALVSDAGSPLVSDPGYKLVREAARAGLSVTALPGASAVLAALTVSALPTDRFFFEGFLPAKSGQRRSHIAALKLIPATLVVFETGPRMAAALADLHAGLGEREAAICRELTKMHEEVRRGTLKGLADVYRGEAEMRGEFVIVIAPPDLQADRSPVDLDELLRDALGRLSLKEAVAEVAIVTGAGRRAVYQRALALERGRSNDG